MGVSAIFDKKASEGGWDGIKWEGMVERVPKHEMGEERGKGRK